MFLPVQRSILLSLADARMGIELVGKGRAAGQDRFLVLAGSTSGKRTQDERCRHDRMKSGTTRCSHRSLRDTQVRAESKTQDEAAKAEALCDMSHCAKHSV